MNLMYYIVGNNSVYYNQCYFSMYSFLQFDDIKKIYIYTDAPRFFKQVSSRIEIVALDEATVRDWRGEVDFSWRVKIKAIESMALRSDDLFLYVDTDTFLYQPLTPMLEGLQQNKAYMHVCEGLLKNMKYTPHRMWKKARGKEFGGIIITDDMPMWNAGVVAIPLDKRIKTIRLALSICDDMCKAGVTRKLIEQYSLSIALDHIYGLHKACDMIAHYWGNKPEWDTLINQFILNQYFEATTFEDSVNQIRKINLKALPYYKHVSSTKKRLMKLINKLFLDKSSRYL